MSWDRILFCDGFLFLDQSVLPALVFDGASSSSFFNFVIVWFQQSSMSRSVIHLHSYHELNQLSITIPSLNHNCIAPVHSSSRLRGIYIKEIRVMTASANRLILQHLASIPSSSSPFDDDEIRGEFITEVALASSKKSKLQIEIFDRFETTKNDFLTPRFMNMRGTLLSPITQSAPRSVESRQFEGDSRQPLSPTLRCSQDLKRSRPGKIIQNLKLKSLTPTNINTLY